MGVVTKDITEGNRVFQGLDVERSMAIEIKEESGTIRGESFAEERGICPIFFCLIV